MQQEHKNPVEQLPALISECCCASMPQIAEPPGGGRATHSHVRWGWGALAGGLRVGRWRIKWGAGAGAGDGSIGLVVRLEVVVMGVGLLHQALPAAAAAAAAA